jgi:hypothetical protein
MDAIRDSHFDILTLLGTYLPGYKAGGPVRSIENLVAALGKEFHFRIVTLDRDLGETLPFPGIVANRWVRVGHADVMYTRPGLRGFLDMCVLLRSVDRHTVLYINSFFARRFSILAAIMHWLKALSIRVYGACATRRVFAGSDAAPWKSVLRRGTSQAC